MFSFRWSYYNWKWAFRATGWINGPRPIHEVHQGKVQGAALGPQQLHAALQARGRVSGKMLVEKALGVLVNSGRA